MSLLFNMLSRLVTTFLPRNKRLLISWLQSPSAVILEPPKIKFDTVSTVSPSISPGIVFYYSFYTSILHFLGGSDVKEFTYNAGDSGLIPGLGRSPREGNG